MSQQEILDIVDMNGEPTGESFTRQEIHDRGLLHRTAHIWIYSPEGKLLLQKRSKTKRDNPGLYDTSSSGHILAGLSPKEGALEELNDELGITEQNGKLEYVKKVYEDRASSTMLKSHRMIAFVYFMALPEDTKFTFNDGETDSVEWIELEAFKDLMLNHEGRAVSREKEYSYFVVEHIKSKLALSI